MKAFYKKPVGKKKKKPFGSMELKVKNIVYFIIMCKLHAISFILVKFIINTHI